MRHLLDLTDLLEEELVRIFQSQQKLVKFLKGLSSTVAYSPLKEWLEAYIDSCRCHKDTLESIFEELFVHKIVDKTSFIDIIIEDYNARSNRILDDWMNDEEAVLTLLHIIHFKLSMYHSLHMMAKGLRHPEEAAKFIVAIADEEDMKVNLLNVMDQHRASLENWYLN